MLVLVAVVGCGRENGPSTQEPAIRRVSTSVSATADVPEREHTIRFDMPEGWSVTNPGIATVIDGNGQPFQARGTSVSRPSDGPETITITVRLPEGSTAKLLRFANYEIDLGTGRIRRTGNAGVSPADAQASRLRARGRGGEDAA